MSDNIQRYLQSFGDKVVQDSLGILQARKGSTALAGSLRVEVFAESTDDFSVKFYMADYGTYVDQGVSGNSVPRTFVNWKQSTKISDYKYTTKQPPPDILARWIQKKGIKGRDKKTGRFISNMALAFIIGRSIKIKGIQGISFFQQPFGIRFQEMKDGFLEEFKKDIDTYLTTFTKF